MRNDGTREFRLAVGMRLRERRAELGLSQEEVAWAAQVAQATLSNYENGRRDIPLLRLISICRALRISPLEVVPCLGRLGGVDLGGRDTVGHPAVPTRFEAFAALDR